MHANEIFMPALFEDQHVITGALTRSRLAEEAESRKSLVNHARFHDLTLFIPGQNFKMRKLLCFKCEKGFSSFACRLKNQAWISPEKIFFWRFDLKLLSVLRKRLEGGLAIRLGLS